MNRKNKIGVVICGLLCILGIFGVVAYRMNGGSTMISDMHISSDVLDIRNQELEKIPENVFNQTHIKELHASHNHLTAIPSQIHQLQNLELLDLADNNLTGVPAEIGQLKNLRILNLSDNQLTGLPYELGNLQKLEILDVSGNDYSEHDLSIITSQLPKTVQIIK